ncbi:MAG: nucleotidyl transferase AbiEii/AbiGii toxin family protein [Spartobacteria bacterium]|nr:nucleotidyl transferase AbiEii/AbiGii toxin family protein [Spartobacteria bacterium]
MNLIATLSADERLTYFEEGAWRLGVVAPIVEKDFWVCWLLGLIFGAPELGGNAVFKGGTSLSKVFGVINRFSEDVDLGLSPESLGHPESEIDEAPTKTARAKRAATLLATCAHKVETEFLPVLEKLISGQLGGKTGGHPWLRYELEEASHSPVIHFDYPTTLPNPLPYIRTAVKIEFGSLTDQRPTGTHRIVPLVAEVAPEAFADFKAEVVALEVERTFWEKATILHAEFHRPADKAQPPRYARHFSDFVALWRHPSGRTAAERLDLLERVRLHKSRYFASSWAHYESAVPGTLRLLPPEFRMAELRRDYLAMRPMFLAEPISFDEMMSVLTEAEETLNR